MYFLNLLAGPMFLATAVIWACLDHYVLGLLFLALALTSAVRFANAR